MGNYQASLIGLLGLIQKKQYLFKLLSFIVTISQLKRKKRNSNGFTFKNEIDL